MKIKSLLAIIVSFAFLTFISCDDDLNDIGQSIQPPSDTISVTVDTIPLKARTISMDDSIYARTISGVLGQYEDDMFGTIKSDYLCQFYFPENTEFKGTFKRIDSVQFIIDYTEYTGDTLAIMGLSLYEVTSPLTQYYYTNVDPAKYCNLEVPLAHEAYSISSSKTLSSTKQRAVIADLNVDFGERLHDEWAKGTFKNDYTGSAFNKFFPGIYVTTTFGSGSLIKVLYTSIDTHYTYTYIKDGVERDSTGVISLSVAEDVIQLNKVQNQNPKELFESTDATYLKTPAGLYTEITFPIGEISKKMQQTGMTTISSAEFSLKAYTEKESSDLNGLTSPSTILLINKDSIDTFFKQPSPNVNNKTTFYASRSTSNVYSFGNIANLISEYQKNNVENVVYYIVPIEAVPDYTYDSYGNLISASLLRVSNYMMPGSAIFRNDANNMRLDLVYSRF